MEGGQNPRRNPFKSEGFERKESRRRESDRRGRSGLRRKTRRWGHEGD
jgi:hypothetical protein